MSKVVYTDAHVAIVEKIEADMTDEQRAALIDLRGGCRCFLCAPCSACCEPVQCSEADKLGWFDDLEVSVEQDQANLKAFVYGKDSEWAQPIDYLAITASLCR